MTESDGHRPQLDGLRAIAMIGVMYVHFWDTTPVAEHVRVTLFFTVSGFLITHLLISAKAAGGSLNVASFYIRRALRLFPALFLTFLTSWIFDADGFRASAAWHLLPTSNIYFSLNQTSRPWVIGHLWSLNVLEQFYLLWPLVIIFLSERAVYVLVVGGFAAVTFARVNAEQLGIDGWWLFFVVAFDPILMGAFAYLIQRVAAVRAALTSRPMIAAAVVVLVSPMMLWQDFGRSESYRFFAQPALAILVIGAFKGFAGPAGWLLQSPVARFLSRISYGVFVYHLILWYAVVQFYPTIFAKNATTFVVMSAVTLCAATLSWYVLEAPISRLKRRFPTRREGSATEIERLVLRRLDQIE